jgi:hypothetical protein
LRSGIEHGRSRGIELRQACRRAQVCKLGPMFDQASVSSNQIMQSMIRQFPRTQKQDPIQSGAEHKNLDVKLANPAKLAWENLNS